MEFSGQPWETAAELPGNVASALIVDGGGYTARLGFSGEGRSLPLPIFQPLIFTVPIMLPRLLSAVELQGKYLNIRRNITKRRMEKTP